MTEETTMTDAAPARRRSALPMWAVVSVAGGFGLFYAYAVWTAVAFLAQQAGGDSGLTGYGWFVLVLPIAFPIIVFGAAFALGWRRRLLPFALLLLTGLGVVAVFWLNVFALTFTASSSIYASL